MTELIEDEIRNNINNSKKVLSSLKKVGKLENGASYDILVELLKYKTKEVRVEAIKHLGKFNGKYIEEILIQKYNAEKDSLAKRECVSSLGRQRNKNLISFFNEVLNEKDPKIVLQAIRALLVFKKNPSVIKSLKRARKHPNEMIQEVLEIELSEKKKRPLEKHSFVSQKLKNVTVNGDVNDILKSIKDESFHLTFTSPPYYNAKDYSFYSSYQEYLDFLRVVFKETHRLTKNGRFLIVNTSPVIIPRVSRSHSSKRYPIPFDVHHFLTRDGWEFIDDIVWKKPEASVKNRIGGFLQHRKPLSYKPNCTTEYLMVYRKKTPDLIDWNLKQYDLKTIEESKVGNGYESTNVWNIDPTFDKTHTAVFPKKLCENVIKYYSFKNDLIFDPFGGSGTLAEVSLKEGRNYFLTELNTDYFERIKEKLSKFDEDKKYFTKKEFQEWMKQKD